LGVFNWMFVKDGLGTIPSWSQTKDCSVAIHL
jgi:hypothetical protein